MGLSMQKLLNPTAIAILKHYNEGIQSLVYTYVSLFRFSYSSVCSAEYLAVELLHPPLLSSLHFLFILITCPFKFECIYKTPPPPASSRTPSGVAELRCVL